VYFTIIFKIKNVHFAGLQWLTPVILVGRDQEDHSLKPAQANSSRDPILKKIHHKKRAGGEAQGEGSEFKPQYCKTKTKQTKNKKSEKNK
jgi:hypothetical protein